MMNDLLENNHVLKLLIHFPVGMDDPEARSVALELIKSIEAIVPAGMEGSVTLRRKGKGKPSLSKGTFKGRRT